MISLIKKNSSVYSTPTKAGILLALSVALSSPLPAVAHGPGLEKVSEIAAQIKESGELPELYVRRARVYQENQLWQEALSDFNRAAQLDPEYVEYDLDRARLHFAAGEYLSALDFVDLYLLRHPNTTDALLVKARTHLALAQHQQAAESYQRALADLSAVDGKPSPEWYVELADLLTMTGDKHSALQALQDGISKLGATAVFQVKAAELEVDLGLYDSALNRVDQLLNQAQRKDIWLTRRADILSAAGRDDEAQQGYQDAYAALQRLPQRLRNLPVSQELQTTLQTHMTRQ